MASEPFTFTEAGMRERARVAGVTFDEAQVPAILKTVSAALEALAAFDARANKFVEPPLTFDARVPR
jgi:hypothetical protein